MDDGCGGTNWLFGDASVAEKCVDSLFVLLSTLGHLSVPYVHDFIYSQVQSLVVSWFVPRNDAAVMHSTNCDSSFIDYIAP